MLTPPTVSVHTTGDYFNTVHSENKSNDEVNDRLKMLDILYLAIYKLRLTPNVTINDGGAIKVYGEKLSSNSKVDIESSKNVRLLLDDPCAKVITSALRKYNVVDDWQQYALWIQYGSHDNIQGKSYVY